jgi:hypothetical protein
MQAQLARCAEGAPTESRSLAARGAAFDLLAAGWI